MKKLTRISTLAKIRLLTSLSTQTHKKNSGVQNRSIAKRKNRKSSGSFLLSRLCLLWKMKMDRSLELDQSHKTHPRLQPRPSLSCRTATAHQRAAFWSQETPTAILARPRSKCKFLTLNLSKNALNALKFARACTTPAVPAPISFAMTARPWLARTSSPEN